MDAVSNCDATCRYPCRNLAKTFLAGYVDGRAVEGKLSGTQCGVVRGRV